MADIRRASTSTDKRKKKYRSVRKGSKSSTANLLLPGRHADLGETLHRWTRNLGVKGKERQTVAECYDLFNSVASELWPEDPQDSNVDSDNDDDNVNDLSIEAQIANEVNAMKKSKKEPRFTNCQTNTICVVFISCKPPVDPVQLVVRLLKDVEATGVVKSRCIHRMVPVTASCGANLPEIQGLCRKVLESFFSQHPGRKFTYKIELRMRNHSVLSRPDLIQHIAKCVPEGHTVELTDPEVFILVEAFKSVCGISVVQNYYALQKFNMTELANIRNGGDIPTEREMFGAREEGTDDARNL